MMRCKKSSTQIFQHKNELISSRHHQHHRINLPLRILRILSLRCVLELSDSAASTGIITIAFVIDAPRSNRDNRLAVISSRRRCHIPLRRLASSPLPSSLRGSPFRPQQSLGCDIIAASVSSWNDSCTLFSIATLLLKHV